jgi:molybdate transport system substrate-binding protein
MMKKIIRILMCTLITAAFVFTPFVQAASPKKTVTVFAAASMQTALDDIIGQFKAANKSYEVRTNYDSSGTLATQINTAGGADVFISASKGSMDKVAQYIVADSRYNIVENKLVAIIPLKSEAPQLDATDEAGNIKLLMSWILNGKMLSVGNYEGEAPVPAGEYTYNLLKTYDDKFFPTLVAKGKINLAQNVTAVLTQVATSAADVGFVYSTDASTRVNDVKVILTLTPLTKIIYPAAILSEGADKKSVKEFFAFLKTDKVKATLTKYGFTAL